MADSKVEVHPAAEVDPRAELGEGVKIGAGAVIEGDVSLGPRTVVDPHAVIKRYTMLGADCRVHSGAVIGDVPQDLDYSGQRSYVRIGRRCIFREGVTVHRGTAADSATVVGDDCFLMCFSHLGHNVCLGRRVILANAALLAGYVQVEDSAFISGHCVVHQFVRLGRLVMMGGMSGVSKDVPPYCLVSPGAINRVSGLNVVGMRRAGMGPDARLSAKRAYRLCYNAGLSRDEAAARIAAEVEGEVGREWSAFMRSSERGLCGPQQGRD